MNYTKKTWTTMEENDMLKAIKNRDTFETIAQRHDRTPNAIKLRFGTVCKRELDTKSKSIEDLCQQYHITKEQVIKYVNDLENIKKSNNTSVSVSDTAADISIIKEEILLINEKLDKIHKNIKKLMDTIRKNQDLMRR